MQHYNAYAAPVLQKDGVLRLCLSLSLSVVFGLEDLGFLIRGQVQIIGLRSFRVSMSDLVV